MLALYFERVFEYRLRSFIWLMLPLINNFMMILFWSGAGINTPAISSYYILLTVGGLLTTSHVELEVSDTDIKQGQLVNHLTKPISYFWAQLLSEVPYRILQALYVSGMIGVLLIFFPHALTISPSIFHIPLIIIIFVMGYMLSFTFKLSLGYLSFWFKDVRGLTELVTIIIIIFSGGIMPLPWYPSLLQTISNILPFAYSGYYCVAALQGIVPLGGLFGIIAVQGVWLGVLLIINNALWVNGIKEFTAVGQ